MAAGAGAPETTAAGQVSSRVRGRAWQTRDPALRPSEDELREWALAAQTRLDLWIAFLKHVRARDVAEIGVYGGDFAAGLLRDCTDISSYYMIDPWRHLDDWNKPANKPDDVFQRLFREAMERTGAYADKRIVLRGKTAEVIDQVPDEGLDFAYVDGDHTLRGITVDLVKVFGKLRDGGCVGGDDFYRSIWHQGPRYEPTLVFPFAVYFAEAVDARIWGLPHNQFLIEKGSGRYEFVDVTGIYGELALRGQLLREAEDPDSGERGDRH